MIHISLDLETLSTSCNATILSLGAVRFDIDKGDILEEFYYLVSMKSSMKLKFNIDPETIKWWMKQSDEARQIFSEKGIGINKVLTIFSEFCTEVEPSGVWGNGVVFDNGILKNAYERCEIPLPWKYKHDRDLRTLDHLAKEMGIDWKDSDIKFEGTVHNALDDARHQAKIISYLWRTLKSK